MALFIKRREIVFKKKRINYFFHKYNHTWANERTIEVPLVLSLIKNVPKENILEIGNVLSHYVRTGWDTLDKYEISGSVINEDALSFKPFKKYKYIISISTLEHIGFDEEPREDEKILKTISNLKDNCLDKNGKIIFTMPIGWNLNLDNLLRQNKINLVEAYYFKRISWDNKWIISNKEEVLKTKFAKPYIGANGLILGVITDVNKK
ncbi:MAG: hypothetical protein PHN56_04955 [Candidatus Nanoarchaeia archaeon]|nr:hypothetical protein [Candidatus Nanoarchaeia archaeon]